MRLTDSHNRKATHCEHRQDWFDLRAQMCSQGLVSFPHLLFLPCYQLPAQGDCQAWLQNACLQHLGDNMLPHPSLRIWREEVIPFSSCKEWGTYFFSPRSSQKSPPCTLLAWLGLCANAHCEATIDPDQFRCESHSSTPRARRGGWCCWGVVHNWK